ncbi:MAG TPA: DUF3795 domain-containing protein [Candidatus Aquicultor sp.]|jgi:hypothetical protein
MVNKQIFDVVKYPAIGVCGLTCVLCPDHNRETESRCPGCKTEFRFGAACPILRCALKNRGVEFCWDCPKGETCEKWQNHREVSKIHDSFICYQKLEDNISFIKKCGVSAFEKVQNERAQLLKALLNEFNEGRSKSYYCIVATILDIEELKEAFAVARVKSANLDIKGKAKLMHATIDNIAQNNGYIIKLRSAKSK